jgi:uncharacterized protein
METENILSPVLDPDFNAVAGNDENEPFRILTVLHDGRLATFSPELAGIDHRRLGDLTFGNVNTDGLSSVLADERFRRTAKEVAAGVTACRDICPYFHLFVAGHQPTN